MERLSVFLYFSLQLISFSFERPLCSSDDSLALLQFKQSLSVSNNLDDYYFHVDDCQYPSLPMTISSWNGSRDCCSWDGVTCDSFTGHVIGLDLRCSQLVGTLHPNSTLFQLRHLQMLDLSHNNFWNSHIPRGIGQLASLIHLNLSYSFLQGGIPSEILHLSKLVSLDLSDFLSFRRSFLQLSQYGLRMLFQNLTKLEVLSLYRVNISSKIPMNISSSLRYLHLGNTNLQGDLPNSIFLLPNLETLKLFDNFALNVSLPKFNQSSSHTLTELDLSGTHVTGGLPSSLGGLIALKVIKLSWCNLIGPIPESITNLSQITELVLSDNHLESKIPDAFSSLQKLTVLELGYNAFGIGPFPSTLVNLTKLQVLRLAQSSLSGPLPLTANGLQNLKEIDLFNNSLNGSIPSWMTSLPSLISLVLVNNRFSGPFPEFKTNSLKHLCLSRNHLYGPIPPSLKELVNLTVIFLGSNNLSGEVGADLFSSMTNLKTLELSSNNLSGEFGAEMFSSMPNLAYLDLSHSGLSCSYNNGVTIFPFLYYLGLGFCGVKDFPNFLMNSTELVYLNLSGNKIHGQFPRWIASFSSFRILNLSHNFLTSLDHIPWQTMEVVDLQSNSVSGPLPSSLCRANNLYFLDLSYNDLSAEIPDCFFNLSSLKILDLRANGFYGQIPNTLPTNTRLVYLSLSKNQLEGPIPRSLINCASLQVLNLGNNNIHDTFPTWLETLQELEVLILKSNRFHGPIVAFQTKLPFTNLRIFDLSGNSFSGSLPVEALKGFKAMMNMDAHKSKLEYMEQPLDDLIVNAYEESVVVVMKNQEIEFEKISKIFTTIDLSRNKFEGEIPKFIGNLNSLLLLNLSHNNLTGHIPIEMKNMSTLESLDLSFNQLTGKIPQEWVSLTFLAVLNLSHNLLVGPIPRQNQFTTFSNDSYVGNRDLCGFPLSNECGDKSAPPVMLDEQENESSFLSEFTWRSVVIGYGCGLILGFTIYYLIYRFERPRWFIDFFASITPESQPYRTKRGGQRRRNFRRRR